MSTKKETKKTAETTTRQAGQERRTTQVSRPEEPPKQPAGPAQSGKAKASEKGVETMDIPEPEKALAELERVVKPGGSVCWQVGYHISEKCVVPLDYIVYDIFTSRS